MVKKVLRAWAHKMMNYIWAILVLLALMKWAKGK